ncbi:hypothetical protein J1N35_015119 [Gossypium stocksii]|uniref:Uncharacterized protein n=1 Tax=Gossypium stocksii TaxID=47602 RepID=A0A9D3VW43_9ROSI|nr:hypothetical protein J1N35_015119 [Gossypium stocksii]
MKIEAMLEKHYSSGSSILDSYVKFVDVDEGGLSSTIIPVNAEMEYKVESPTTQLCSGSQYIRRSDVVLITFISERITNPGHTIGVDNKEGSESNNDQIWEFELNGSKITLYLEPKSVFTEPKDGSSKREGLENFGGTHPNFKPFAPLTHMYNIDLDAEGGLDFLELPHRRLGHASSCLVVDDLQIGMEFSSKDAL